MKLALFVAVLLAVFAGCEAANDTWTVMSENIMTICMALDFFTSTVGVVSGMANGAGVLFVLSLNHLLILLRS